MGLAEVLAVNTWKSAVAIVVFADRTPNVKIQVYII